LTEPAAAGPVFGEPLPIQRAPEVLSFLARRRSASAQALTAPGPDATTLDRILTLAGPCPRPRKARPLAFHRA
jgi:hypothetical protein